MKTSKMNKLISIVLSICFFFEINISGITNVYAASNIPIQPDTALEDEDQNETFTADENLIYENEDYTELIDKRELGIKYFMMGDGRYETVMYGSPVHYLDNGKYSDIDNSLSLQKDINGKSYYTNKANNFKVFIASSLDEGWSAGISQGEYEMKWKLERTYTGKNGEASTYLSIEDWKKLSKKDQKTERPNLDSQVKFNDVLSDTTLDYQVISNLIKESITINSYNGINVFNQRISLKGLELIKKEDGTIVAVDSEDHSKEVFYLPKPFAIDSGYDENFNEDIDVTLTNIKRMDESDLDNIIGTIEQPTDTAQPEATPAVTESPETTPAVTESPEATPEPAVSDQPSETDDPIDSSTETSALAEEELAAAASVTPEATEAPAVPSETPEVAETIAPTESIEEATNISKHLFADATNTYILTYTLDEEYLKNATYPVVIDPTITTSLTCSNIKDTRISEVYHSTNYGNSYLTCTGDGSSSGKNYALVNFISMPTIESSCMITKATFKMEKESTSSVNSYVAAHQITQAWTESTVTWDSFFSSTQTYDPEFTGQHWNPEVEDFREVYTPSGTVYPWDVTNIVKKWYSGSPRYGILLRDMSTYYKGWCAAESYGKEPCIVIDFVDYSGLESYWDYASAGLDRSGTANANIYNGNLVYTHTDLAMSGNLMPISITHVFNSTTRNADMLYGEGWRTNYDQRIEFIDHTLPQYSYFTKDYYKYTDGDGTVHYFEKNDDNKWMEESGIGYEVKIEDGAPVVVDKQKNKLIFYPVNDANKPGFLYKIRSHNYVAIDNEIEQIVGYDTNNRIETITDGAGREVIFTRDTNNNLYQIREEIAASTYRDTMFTYTSNKLTRITYPDGKYTEFSYDANGNIDQVYGVDGKQLDLDYQSSFGDAEPYRISYMGQSTATQEGSELSFKYGRNYTKLTDSEDRTATYQFNDNGNTICVIGPDGSAGYAKFGTSAGDMGKIISASKTQKFGKNYLINHNFEATQSGWAAGGSDTTKTVNYTTTDKYLGIKSAYVIKTAAAGDAYTYQNVTLTPGNTYTLSGYVKTSNIVGTGTALMVDYTVGTVTTSLGTERLTGTNGWQRYQVTFTLPGDASSTVKIYGQTTDATGTAWFDCLQLEDGVIANRYNLVENADFDYVTSGVPNLWTRNANCGTSDVVVTTTDNENPSYMSDNRFHINASVSKTKYIQQVINMPGGKMGDTYVIGGWAKGRSTPLITSTIRFSLAVRFDDGPWQWFNFSEDIDGWQYLCGKATASGNYSSVTVDISVNYNANYGEFDGIQLFKEGFDNVLEYYEDDQTGGNEGDLHYIKYPDGRVEHFTYDANHNMLNDDPEYDLEHSTNSAYVSSYEYDAYNNLITSTSSTGVVTAYNYDTNHPGLLLGTQVGDTTNYIKSTTTYNSNNNYIDKTTDPFGKQVDYTYDTFTGLLKDVTDPLQNTVHNTYDEGINGTDQLTGVSLTSGGTTVSNSYEYTNYRLSKVSHSATGGSVDYNIHYNSLGWNTGTSVGTQPIATNSLQAHTGRLNSVTYHRDQGNDIDNVSNEIVNYGYDDYDRLILVSQGTTPLYGYAYDNCGRIGYMKDYVQNAEYRYEYDIMDRAIKTYKKDLTTGDVTTNAYTYNTQSQMTAFNEEVNGTSYITGYTYDYDKRPVSSTFKTLYQDVYSDTYSKDIAYDNTLDTVTGYSFNKNGTPFYNTSIDYYEGAEMGTGAISPNSSRIESITNGVGRQDAETLSYEHDDRGFITKVSKDANNYSEYFYDALGELERENYKWGTTSYTMKYIYDVGGNFDYKEKYDFVAGDGQVGAAIDTIDYTYDTVWKDKLASYDGASISYDDIGNPLTDGTWTYTWEQGRRLSTISNGITSASYKYNNSGIRTQKTVGGTTTVFNLVGDNITWQRTGTNIIYFLYDSGGKLWGLKYGSNTYFYVRNVQGDILKIVDNAGIPVVEYEYDAWGKLLTISDTSEVGLGTANPFRYRGYYYDNETGLYYLNARYYNPNWGRFINADCYGGSTGKLLSHNVFAYCSNNPVMMSDPSGNREIITDDAFSKEERVLQSLWRIAKRLPKNLQRDLYKSLEGLDLNSVVIDVKSREFLNYVKDPDYVMKEILYGFGEAGLVSAIGLNFGPVGWAASALFIMFNAAAHSAELDKAASEKCYYTTYNIVFNAKGNLNQIEIRLQPPCYEWQPYSSYNQSIYFNNSSFLY